MSILNNLKVGIKLICLMLIPLITLIVFSVVLISERYQIAQESALLKHGVTLATKISLVIHELQKERGTSAGFLGSQGRDFKEALQDQRNLSDEKIKELHSFLTEFDLHTYPKNVQDSLQVSLEAIGKINEIRKGVDSLNVKVGDVLGYYTGTIARNIQSIVEIINISTNNQITRNLVAYVNFLNARKMPDKNAPYFLIPLVPINLQAAFIIASLPLPQRKISFWKILNVMLVKKIINIISR